MIIVNNSKDKSEFNFILTNKINENKNLLIYHDKRNITHTKTQNI
jgi:hypothetical protein